MTEFIRRNLTFVIAFILVCLVFAAVCWRQYIQKSGADLSDRQNLPKRALDKPPLYVEEFDPPPESCVVTGDGEDDFTSCVRRLISKDNSGASDYTAAASTLRSCLTSQTAQSSGKRQAFVIGHGLPGLVRAGGDGDDPPDPDQRIANDNSPDWTPSFQNLGATELTLLGCWTGATTDGRALVRDMSLAAKARVRAQNSIIFCNEKKGHLYVEKEHQWICSASDGSAISTGDCSGQTALAVRVPKPEEFSCLKIKKLQTDEFEELRIDTDTIELRMLSLTSFRFPPLDMSSNTRYAKTTFRLEAKDELTLEFLRNQTKRLLREIDFCQPGEPGVPALAKTGSFDLMIKGVLRHFVILGNTIVQDRDRPEVLYGMNGQGFIEFQNQFRSEWESILEQNGANNQHR